MSGSNYTGTRLSYRRRYGTDKTDDKLFNCRLVITLPHIAGFSKNIPDVKDICSICKATFQPLPAQRHRALYPASYSSRHEVWTLLQTSKSRDILTKCFGSSRIHWLVPSQPDNRWCSDLQPRQKSDFTQSKSTFYQHNLRSVCGILYISCMLKQYFCIFSSELYQEKFKIKVTLRKHNNNTTCKIDISIGLQHKFALKIELI